MAWLEWYSAAPDRPDDALTLDEAGAVAEWWVRTRDEAPPRGRRWRSVRGQREWVADRIAVEYCVAAVPGFRARVDGLPVARAAVRGAVARMDQGEPLPAAARRWRENGADVHRIGAPGTGWHGGAPPARDPSAAAEHLRCARPLLEQVIALPEGDERKRAGIAAGLVLSNAAWALGRPFVGDVPGAVAAACLRFDRGHDWLTDRCPRCETDRGDPAAELHCTRRSRRSHGGEGVTRDRVWYAASLLIGEGAGTLRELADRAS